MNVQSEINRGSLGRVVVLVGMVLGAVVVSGNAAAAGGAGSGPTVPLDPIGNPLDGGNRCPDRGRYWNLVVEPDGSEFDEIRLDLDGSLMTIGREAMIPRRGLGDVYVAVPSGRHLESLHHARSHARVTPSSGTATPTFRVDHICGGGPGGSPPRPISTSTLPPTTIWIPPSTSSTTTTTTTTTTAPPITTPPTTDPPTTTTPPTSSTTSTTTAPTTTIPVDDDVEIGVDGICVERSFGGGVRRYWHELRNDTDLTLTVDWVDGTTTIPADDTETVASAAPMITLTVDGEIVGASEGAPDESCVAEAVVTKVVEGPERPSGGAQPAYTLQVSRLVDGIYLPDGDPFQLVGGQSATIPLSSTLDPDGIRYRIDEIDRGGADVTTVTPDSFVVSGHRTESVPVTVRNRFAEIGLVKTVDDVTTALGEQLVYTLVASNTGAVTLDPVMIFDRLPPEVSFVGAVIAGDAGSCAVVEQDRPQLIRCEFDEPLTPGSSTAQLDITVVVVEPVSSDDVIVNQAMVIGDFDGDQDPGLPIGLSSRGPACLPVVGEACALAAAASAGADVASLAAAPGTVEAPATPVLSNAGDVTGRADATHGGTTVAPIRLPATGPGEPPAATIAGMGLATVGGGLLVLARRRNRPVGT